MFEYFKKKKAERLARKEEKLQRKLKYRNAIQKEVQRVKDMCGKEASELNDFTQKYASRGNSTCPKCKSTKVVNKVSRIKGDIKGEFSGHSNLLWGESSGNIDGKIDTYDVNRCTECGNEWKKEKANFYWGYKRVEEKIKQVLWLLEDYHEAENCTFDEDDLKEKYNSLEEKRAALLEKCNTSTRYREVVELWKGISVQAFEFLFFDNFKYDSYYKDKLSKYYDEDRLLSLGFTKLEE